MAMDLSSSQTHLQERAALWKIKVLNLQKPADGFMDVHFAAKWERGVHINCEHFCLIGTCLSHLFKMFVFG